RPQGDTTGRGASALADLEQPRRAPARQTPLGDPRQDLQPIQFLHAQREESGHPGTVPEKRTSLLWRNRTFALGAYRATSDKERYVNFLGSDSAPGVTPF